MKKKGNLLAVDLRTGTSDCPFYLGSTDMFILGRCHAPMSLLQVHIIAFNMAARCQWWAILHTVEELLIFQITKLVSLAYCTAWDLQRQHHMLPAWELNVLSHLSGACFLTIVKSKEVSATMHRDWHSSIHMWHICSQCLVSAWLGSLMWDPLWGSSADANELQPSWSQQSPAVMPGVSLLWSEQNRYLV